MNSTLRRKVATGFAAAALGAGGMLVTAGPASAGVGDDGVNMACAKVTDTSKDAKAAAAAASAGVKLEGAEQRVGFSCKPVKDPADANFCATATATKEPVAFGTPGACPG